MLPLLDLLYMHTDTMGVSDVTKKPKTQELIEIDSVDLEDYAP